VKSFISPDILADTLFFNKKIPMKRRNNTFFPKRVILAPTDPIYAAIRRAGGCTDRDGRIDLFRYALLPACEEKTAVAGPALGAPAAALLMERLVPEGVEEILLFSVCGSLDPALRIGNLFLPTGGIREEGTSLLYREGPVPPPSPRLTEKIRSACRVQGQTLKEGVIWTTDAPGRETPEKVAQYQERGALTVDMEFTAVATVADYHGIGFAALMVISDERRPEEPRIGFHTNRFREGLKNGALLAIEVISC